MTNRLRSYYRDYYVISLSRDGTTCVRLTVPIAIGIIQGQNRNQIALFPVSLGESIDTNNEVRIIDLFVDSLLVKEYGFRTNFPENGRPAYHPSDLLKLFIYGYLNKVRSSRDSTKLRAQNSKKNNFNQAKIDRHLAYTDNKLDDYTRALAENDEENQRIIQEEIKKQ